MSYLIYDPEKIRDLNTREEITTNIVLRCDLYETQNVEELAIEISILQG